MEDITVPFGSLDYWLMFAVMCFSRAMDFWSTRIATPTLRNEGNPIARWLGWRWGGVLNFGMCVGLAWLPLAVIIVSTSSLLVAARNFQQAWLMRVLGETRYSLMISELLTPATRPLYLLCSSMQAILVLPLGAGLIYFGGRLIVPVGIGVGMVAYAIIVFIFTVLSEWRRAS